MKLKLLMLVVPFFVACSPVNPPKSPEAEAKDSFSFFGGGTATTARIVEPDLLWSSVGSVQTFNEGYRGRWKEETVDLHTRENLIEGTIGSFRTELHITPSADGFRLDGTYRGGLGQLEVTAKSITGTVGASWISVARKGGAGIEYTSQNTGLGGELRTLRLPAQFGSLPRERQALYLALVIGS